MGHINNTYSNFVVADGQAIFTQHVPWRRLKKALLQCNDSAYFKQTETYQAHSSLDDYN